MDGLNISYNDITPIELDDITRLLEATHLKSVNLSGNEGIFASETSTQGFTRVLSTHKFVKKLNISYCYLGDEGICFIADGLVGNTTIEVLDIGMNCISSYGLVYITRLVKPKRLKTIDLGEFHYIFNDDNTTMTLDFVATFVENATIEELTNIDEYELPGPQHAVLITTTSIVCARNKCLNHVN
jgi:Leucine Rich repeat